MWDRLDKMVFIYLLAQSLVCFYQSFLRLLSHLCSRHYCLCNPTNLEIRGGLFRSFLRNSVFARYVGLEHRNNLRILKPRDLEMAEYVQKDHAKPMSMPRYSTFPPKNPVREHHILPKISTCGHGIVLAIEETGPSKHVPSAPPKAYLQKSKALKSTPKSTASTPVKSPPNRFSFSIPSQSHPVPPTEERSMMTASIIHRPASLFEESLTTPLRPSLHTTSKDERPATPTDVSLNRAGSPLGKRPIMLLPSLKLVVPSIVEKSINSIRTSSPTLMRSNSAPSPGLLSPISPVMRSIFPRYNPTLSLASQHYYPSSPNRGGSSNEVARLEALRSPAYAGSVDSRAEISGENILGTVPRSPIIASPSGSGIPSRISGHAHTLPSSPISTPKDLLDLWSIANGQGSQEAAATYTLGLSW